MMVAVERVSASACVRAIKIREYLVKNEFYIILDKQVNEKILISDHKGRRQYLMFISTSSTELKRPVFVT